MKNLDSCAPARTVAVLRALVLKVLQIDPKWPGPYDLKTDVIPSSEPAVPIISAKPKARGPGHRGGGKAGTRSGSTLPTHRSSSALPPEGGRPLTQRSYLYSRSSPFW